MGRKLQSYDQLPELMKAEIAENYPEYTAPPPLDDTRRNETSWTYMKKIIDSRAEKPASQGITERGCWPITSHMLVCV